MRFLPTLSTSAAAVLILTCTSCSRSANYDSVPTFPVTGTVIVDGKPVEGANVKLTPIDEIGSPDALTANGMTTGDGTFKLSTYVQGDGAPAGEYAVTIYWLEPPKPPRSKDPGPDRLRRKYADPAKSAWKVEVHEEENVLSAFEVSTR